MTPGYCEVLETVHLCYFTGDSEVRCIVIAADLGGETGLLPGALIDSYYCYCWGGEIGQAGLQVTYTLLGGVEGLFCIAQI